MAWLDFYIIVGFGINVMQIIWVTLLYDLVPGDKLGRVSSVDLLGRWGSYQLGRYSRVGSAITWGQRRSFCSLAS